MKYFCVVLLAAVIMAEPPQYRQAKYVSQRQGYGVQVSAPYSAAGYKPTKEFNLPSHQELTPQASNFGVPADSYGAPFNTFPIQNEYGAPRARSTEKDDKNEVENIDGKANLEEEAAKLEEPKNEAEVVSAEGAYYVLLPGSQLQRVQFQTEKDVRNMAYTARLQYKNEDRAPIFVYNVVPQYQTAAYVQSV